MERQTIFLGANSYQGFFSLYDEYIASLSLRRLYVLKGGAGCGKSTFMRRIAERAETEGEAPVLVLCSGDPDSLDGIILPDRGIALFDGTSPHVLEPSLVGYKGYYIDLSRFYLSPSPGLEPWDRGYREHYRKAYLYLSAAGSVEAASLLPEETADAIRRRARALAERSLKRGRSPAAGTERRYFTDAFTCKGNLTLPETRRLLTPRLIALTGDSQRSDLFLRSFRELALERGCQVHICPDPLRPARIAHLLLPELGFGVTTGEGDRRIHLERLGSPPTEAERNAQREAEQMKQSLLHKAKKELSLAKHDHDRLEAAVHAQVDFQAADAAAKELADRLFGSR